MDNTIKKALEQAGVTQLYAYSRKSRDIDEQGLAKHHDIIKELADKLGYPVTFYEEVESSETLNRPMLNQLRKDIGAKRVKALIVYRMDRLSRKVTDTERLVKEFSFNGVLLIEAHREKLVDYNEILGIKLEAMMSDLYQEQAKLVLHAGRKKAVALYGNNLGEAPLGYSYNRVSKKLEPDEMAVVVQEIFDLYLKGYSTHSIAVKLNNRGLRTKRGGLFKGKAIWTILKNEKYTGLQVYGREEWYKDGDGAVQSKKRPKDQWIVYPSAHEPLVSQATFSKVQTMLNNSINGSSKERNHAYPLTGLVKCGKCGRNMPMLNRVQRKTPHSIRACVYVDVETDTKCDNKGVPSKMVEDFIINQLFTVVRPFVLTGIRGQAKGKKSLTGENRGSEFDRLTKQQKELEKQLDKLIEMQLEHKTDRVTVKMKQVEAQLDIIADRLVQVSTGEDLTDPYGWVEVFLKESEDLVGLPFSYRGMTDEDKNIFLKKYVKSVTLIDKAITGIKFTEEVEQLIEGVNRTEEMAFV